MWEYKRIKRTGQSPDEIFQILNELGTEGWELIQYEESGVTFSCHKDATYLAVLKKLVKVPKID